MKLAGTIKVTDIVWLFLVVAILAPLLLPGCSSSRIAVKEPPSISAPVRTEKEIRSSFEMNYNKKDKVLYISLKFPPEAKMISASLYNFSNRRTDQIRFYVREGFSEKRIANQKFMDMNQQRENQFLISMRILETSKRNNLVVSFRLQGDKKPYKTAFTFEKVDKILKVYVNDKYFNYIDLPQTKAPGKLRALFIFVRLVGYNLYQFKCFSYIS